MRGLLKFISAAGLALALASSAQALQFTNSTVSFGLSSLPPLVATGTGSGNSPGPVTILTPAWAATGPVLITLAPTAAAPLTALNIVLTAPGPCAALPGSCPLAGTSNALVGGAPFLVVPLSGLGVAGRISFGPYGSYIDAQPWTTGVASPTVGGVPITDGYGAPIQTTGYDNRTPGGAGVVKLVAPAGLMSTLGGNLPLNVIMTLNFIPEPGTLLLLGSGVAGLAILGRKRQRAR
jgi:hypothetical protein